MSQAYRFAVLCDHFKLTPLEIAGLTDYQINCVMLAKRKKTGEIEEPPEKAEKPSRTRHKADTPPSADQQKRLRWAEYYQSYNALNECYAAHTIDKATFDAYIEQIQTKFADLFADKQPQEPKADSEQVLKAHLQSGLLSQQQYNEAVAKLKKGNDEITSP